MAAVRVANATMSDRLLPIVEMVGNKRILYIPLSFFPPKVLDDATVIAEER